MVFIVQKQQHSCFRSDVSVALDHFNELLLNIMFYFVCKLRNSYSALRVRRLESQRKLKSVKKTHRPKIFRFIVTVLPKFCRKCFSVSAILLLWAFISWTNHSFFSLFCLRTLSPPSPLCPTPELPAEEGKCLSCHIYKICKELPDSWFDPDGKTIVNTLICPSSTEGL